MIKNVFVKTGEAPYVEAFATVALIPMVLALIVQKTRIANLLTRSVNFLKTPSNKTHQVFFYTTSATIYLLALVTMIRSLLDNYDLASSDPPSGVSQGLIWLVVLGVIQITLKLVILGLGLLASLWTWISWQAKIKTVLDHMKVFELSEYLTRKVASYLYTFYFVFIIGLAAVGIPIYASTTYGINQDYVAFLIVALAGVIVTSLVILAIRLVFELVVTVVYIAEKNRQRNCEFSFEFN